MKVKGVRVGHGGRLRMLPGHRSKLSFGMEAFVGPFGAGKTLLAVHFARQYRGRRCLGYDCGVKGCEQVWSVYTNIPSTWDEEHHAWAKPLDVVEQWLSHGEPPNHAVVTFDESYWYADARRSMNQSSLDIIRRLMQIRKRSLKVQFVLQNFDDMDKRIRGSTARVYQCWTPNEGRSVSAVVHTMARGDIPPWLRKRQRPHIVTWHTEASKAWYNTHDMIQAEDDLASRKHVEQVLVRTPDGALGYLTIPDLVHAAVQGLAHDEVSVVTPEEVAERIQRGYSIELEAKRVRRYLLELGYLQEPGGKFRIFLLGVA